MERPTGKTNFRAGSWQSPCFWQQRLRRDSDICKTILEKCLVRGPSTTGHFTSIKAVFTWCSNSLFTLFRKGIHSPEHCTLAAESGLYFSNEDTLYFSQMKGNLALQSARLLKSEKREPKLQWWKFIIQYIEKKLLEKKISLLYCFWCWGLYD